MNSTVADRFVRLRKEQEAKRIEEEQRQEILDSTADESEVSQAFMKQVAAENWTDDKDALLRGQALEDWLTRFEEDPQADAVGHLAHLLNRHVPGLLDNPDKTKGKKQKPVFSDRQRGIAHRVLALQKRAAG